MQEKEFIQKGARKVRLHEFLEDELEGAGYSHAEIERTPTSTKVIVHAQKPGLVIGRGGSRIRELTEDMENAFNFENPQIEVNEIENGDANAEVVAKSIADWLEKGGHAKRVGYTYLRRMKEAGAIGAELEITGKLSGNRGRTEKFSFGYVKRCGNTSKENVQNGYSLARTKPGAIGVKVRIMKEMPQFLHRDVDVSEEVLHISTEETQRDKTDRIQEVIIESEDMTSAALEKALETKEETIKTEDISKDEVRDAFESIDDIEELEKQVQDNQKEETETEKTTEENETSEDETTNETEESNEEQEETETEETSKDVEELVSGTITDAKDAINEMEEPDYEAILQAEADNKDRKTFKDWLETQQS